MASHGGYRKGAGFSKKGYVDGLLCESTWEAAFVRYVKHLGLTVDRCGIDFAYKYKGSWHKYRPDFIVNGHIVEVKGSIKEVDYFKWSYVRTWHKRKIIIVSSKEMLSDIIPFIRLAHPEMMSKKSFKLCVFDKTCKEYSELKTALADEARAERMRLAAEKRELLLKLKAEKRAHRASSIKRRYKTAVVSDSNGLNCVNKRTLAAVANTFSGGNVKTHCLRLVELVKYLTSTDAFSCASVNAAVIRLRLGRHYNTANKICRSLFGKSLSQLSKTRHRVMLTSPNIYGIPYATILKIASGEI